MGLDRNAIACVATLLDIGRRRGAHAIRVELDAWVAKQRAAHREPATIYRRVMAVRSLLAWLAARGESWAARVVVPIVIVPREPRASVPTVPRELSSRGEP